MLKRRTKPIQIRDDENVVTLRQRFLAHHRTVLNRWLQAGRRMGLCDASVCLAGPGQAEPDHVVVWVRENPDPAYMIAAEGMSWRVSDCIQGRVPGASCQF